MKHKLTIHNINHIVFTNALYLHSNTGNYYRTREISYIKGSGIPLISYNRCNEKGIYERIIDNDGSIVQQPFNRTVEDFNKKILIPITGITGIFPKEGNIETEKEVNRFEFIREL